MKRIALAACIVTWMAFFFPQRAVGEASWVSIGPFGGGVQLVLQDYNNANVLILATEGYPGRLFRSYNKGVQWSEIPSDFSTSLAALKQNRKNFAEFFACGSNSFYRTTDWGVTWSSTYLASRYFSELCPDSMDQNILHAGGYTWDPQASKTSMTYFRSTNRGKDWNVVMIPSTGNGYSQALTVESNNSSHVWMGGYAYEGTDMLPKVYRTTNAGTDWTDVTGTIAGYVYDIFVDSTTVKRILAVTSSNTYRSTNNGASWQMCAGYPSGNKLVQDPTNRNTFYIAGYNTVYRSTDGGASWTPHITGLAGKTGNDIVVDRKNPANVFGAFALGFYRSTDSGSSWASNNTGLSLADISAVRVVPGATPGLLAAFYNDGLYKTANPLGKADGTQAVTWERLPTFYDCHNLTDLQVLPSDPKVMYAFEGGG